MLVSLSNHWMEVELNSEQSQTGLIHGAHVYQRALHKRHSLIAHRPRRLVASVCVLFLEPGKKQKCQEKKRRKQPQGSYETPLEPLHLRTSCQDNVSPHSLILLQETTTPSRVIQAFKTKSCFGFYSINNRFCKFYVVDQNFLELNLKFSRHNPTT